MLSKFFKKEPSVLAELLANAGLREELLGVSRVIPATPERQLYDLNKVREFANSQDYAIWAKEAWTEFIQSFDKLLDPKATREQVDFERGRCMATLNLLRIAYKPQQYDAMVKKQIQRNSATPSR